MKKLLFSLFILLSNIFYAQTVIFSENMGNPTGTTAIASHVFENNAPIVFAGTADVRTTLPSTYTNASASGNVNFANTIGRYLVISGINTLNYSNIVLSFGHYKSTTTSNNELKVEVSADSVSWTQLTYTRPTGAGTAVWAMITTSGSIPSTSNLRVRFTQTSAVPSFRIDDVKLVGDLPVGFPLITSSLNVSNPINTAFNYNITTSNPATSFTASGLPAGLTINTSTGLISGTPTIPGNYNVTISASNGTYTDTRTLKLKITCTTTVSIQPTSGPPGTVISITPTNPSLFDMSFATATIGLQNTNVISALPNMLKVQLTNNAISGNIIATNGLCISNGVPFNVVYKDTTSCELSGGTIVYTDLFISEVYDAEVGQAGIVELYNPTAAAITLTGNYTLKRFATVGLPTPSTTLNLTGNIPPNSTLLLGVDSVCGILPSQSFSTGFNDNDEIRLEKGGNILDVVYTPTDGPGYNMKRKNTVSAPSTTFNSNDWFTDLSESCLEHDLGKFNPIIANAPIIEVEPILTYGCDMTEFSLKVKAVESKPGGNPLAYQWYSLDSGSNTWVALTNSPDFIGVDTDSLIVKNINTKIGAQYYVQVRENSATCFRNSYVNYLNRNSLILKPNISSSLNNQSLCLGSNLNLKLNATGVNFFKWFKNDTLILGNTSDSFVKNNILASDTGTYKIVAYRNSSCADSSIAKVSFSSSLNITNAPQSATISAGGNYILSVTAPGATSYQWKKNGVIIPGATSATLNINNAIIANDTGCYKVMCYRSAPCSDSVESSCAILSVSGSGPCPVISTQPKDTFKICINDSFRINISGANYNALQWYKNGIAIPGATSSSYFVNSAASSDAAIYKVELIANTGSGCPNLFSNNSVVRIATPPILTSSPQKSFLCEPDSQRLLVVGTNYSNVIWYKNNVIEPTLSGPDVMVKNITESNDYYFAELVGINGCPSVRSSQVRVIKRPPNKYAYLTPVSLYDLTEQCLAKDGFVYYTKDKDDQFLFGIRSFDTSVGFSPDIELMSSNVSILPLPNSFNQGFIYGKRLFNVDLTKDKLKYSYDVRFLFNETDSSSITDIFLQLKQIYGNQIVAYNNDLLFKTSTLVPFTSNLLNNVLDFNSTISATKPTGRLNNIPFVDIKNLVADHGGGTFVMMYQLSKNSSLIDNHSTNSISIYPNPASDFVAIKMPNITTPVDFSITDIFGKTLYESFSNRISAQDDFKIGISELANGNYIVKIQIQGAEPIYKKLLIEK